MNRGAIGSVVLAIALLALVANVSHAVEEDRSSVSVRARVAPGEKDQGWSGSRTAASRVSVATVAILTLGMAAATGLGAVPFFFVELQAKWAGLCNGIASGVMLAASFDLIQEGQRFGGGNWVVAGILSGGLFILYSQKVLERFGDVKLMDVKGADARKMLLVIGIMTLHSFGEGSGVGVSFAGPKGLSQGLTVTLAIAVHNIPEGLAVSMVLASRGVSARNAMLWSTFTSLPQPLVAVPAFICAEAFQKFLPLCMGFAAGCMIWMVLAEVLPDSFKDADASEVASAATVSIAFMEILSAVMESGARWNNTGSALLWSLLFGLGPFIGGLALVSLVGSIRLPYSFFGSVGSGIALVLALWRPSQLWLSGKMDRLVLSGLFFLGTCLWRLAHLWESRRPRKAEVEVFITKPKQASSLASGAILAAGTMGFHAFAEGLALGVAASKAYGLGTHMLLPVCLHGLPRGAAVASTIYGATGSWQQALVLATVTGFASPVGAIVAILGGLSYSGLDFWMVVACGSLVPAFGRQILVRAAGRRGASSVVMGLVTGFGFASALLTSTRMVCLYTPYCSSAPEAVT
ncbi:putative zinc transporter At3g08650 [Selaginella moellendorffii]|nr:putative zinc transporter At3g08650 [Selaginella moellendorffii]|eukprot:XP_002987600.2 putative zinc transporter At3g08650 [Selaginella moellendorffii]